VTRKPKFTIGQPVAVRAIAKADYEILVGNPCHRCVKRQPCDAFVGVIVGARKIRLGYYMPGNLDDSPSRLQPTGDVVVWLVTRGMLNTPLQALEADIEPHEGQHVLPWRWQHTPTYSPEFREACRAAAAEQNRKDHHRFTTGFH
jgi:hypothetical protein